MHCHWMKFSPEDQHKVCDHVGTGMWAVRPTGQSQGQKPETKARVRAGIWITPKVEPESVSGVTLRVVTGVIVRELC